MNGKGIVVSAAVLLAGVHVALAQSQSAVQTTTQTGAVSSASQVLEAYARDMKAHPVPEKLKACTITAGSPFHLKAAIGKAKGGSTVEITVATEEGQLPANTLCLFLCMTEKANVKGVGKMIGELGAKGLISSFSSEGLFVQGLLSRKGAKTLPGVSLFEGELKSAMGAVNMDRMEFDGYILVQLCANESQSPWKSVSNAIFVRIAR